MRLSGRSAVAAALVATSARAVSADEPVGEVIEVTELRQPRPATYDPATVIVLDRAELERVPAPTADDLVRVVPSVGLFRRSSSSVADPTSQGLNLRGLGPSGVSRALVLRDGIPVNDPFGGWVYWRSLPVHAIDRLEIQPSGASAVFGNYGLGGVLAIGSRSIDDSAAASLSIGSRDTLLGSARASQRIRGIGIEIDGDRSATDGYVPVATPGAIDHAAASDHENAGARVEYRGAQAFVRYFSEHLDAGTQHTTADVEAISYGAKLSHVDRGTRFDFAAFGGRQTFEQTRARIGEGRATAELASSQRTPSSNWGTSALATRAIGAHTLQLGVDAIRVRGTATDSLIPAAPMPDSLVERSAGGEQLVVGAFVQDGFAFGKLELAGAVRVDRWSQRDGSRVLARNDGTSETTAFADRDGVELSPRLGALVRIDDNLALRASVYRAFRAPTLNELYRPFQVGTVLTAANEALRTETLWGGEVGPQLVVGTVTARAIGFYNRLSDPIFNVTLEMPVDGAQRQRQNVGAARVMGIELEAAWRPIPSVTITVAHLAIDAQVIEATQAELVGKRLAQDPKARTSLSVAYDDPEIVTAAIDARYAGTQFEDDLNTLPMGAYVTLDALVRRRLIGGVSAFATIQNALDRRYVVGRAGIDTLGQPRTVMAGISWVTGR